MAEGVAYLAKAGAKASRAFAVREARTPMTRRCDRRAPRRASGSVAISEIREARAGLYFVVSEFDRSRAEAER